MYQTILTHFADHILTISVNRPEKLNALNATVINELGTALDGVYGDDNIRAAIITGVGPKAFVAGADISEFTGMDGKAGTELAKRGQEKVFNRIENCPKPIIAAVNGFALGGGCELAMACHFRIASDNARFGQPEVNLGLIPGYGGTQRLTQLIGKGRAMEYTLTGNMISAADAFQWGLVNRVTTPSDLLTTTLELLQSIITKAPLAIGKAIALINIAAVGDENGLTEEIKAFGDLFDTNDASEGTAAFLEKRKPVFTGT